MSMEWTPAKTCLWVWCIALHLVLAAGLEFLSEPSSILVKVSDGRAVFRCEVSPSSATVHWLWKGEPVEPNRWLKVSKHKLTVHLNKMDKIMPFPYAAESGSFQCEAKLKSKVLVSAPAELIVAVLEPFPSQNDVSITATKGATAVIPCHPPRSVPTVITEFLFNNSTISKPSSRHLLMSSGNLQILDVSAADSGEYVCIANNPYLAEKVQANHKVFLHVKEPTKPESPQFLVSPKPKIVAILGSNITIECAGAGFPILTFTWKKPHGHLPHRRHQQIGGNLLLFSVHRGDEGTYLCEAENAAGAKITASTLLEVHETPQIIKPPKDMIVEAGHNLSLHCGTHGHPKPVVTWIHNGKRVASESDTKRDSELVLHHVTHKQAGIYQCFASNALGSVYDTSIVVVSYNNQSFTEHHRNEDYDDYGDVNEDLESSKFHWKDTKVAHGNHHPGDKPHHGSSGGEPVRKKHRKKKKHKGVKLVAPSKPEVTRLSDTSVMVRWGVPRNDGLPILFFKVQYREVGKKGSRWMTIDEDIAAHIHSYAVTDLHNGGKYRFRIAAVYSNYDNKPGPNSAKFSLYKDPSMKKPLIGPVITHAEAVSPSAITLFWEYSDLDIVPIEGFFIYYRATHSAGDYLKVTVLGANTRSHIISHLLPDTSYDVKMHSFNSAGTSEFSNILTCKTNSSENVGLQSSERKSHHSENDEHDISITEPVSSKDSQGNVILNAVLGIISSAMFVAIVIFVVLYIRQRSNRQRQPSGGSREASLKMGNGHSNGYIPVTQITVNPASEIEGENETKCNQNGSAVSNNNEIIALQTFASSEPPADSLATAEAEEESAVGAEEANAVIQPGT